MLFKEIITVNSLERQPAIKGGPVLIRNINKLLREWKKETSCTKDTEESKPQDVLQKVLSKILKRFVRFIKIVQTSCLGRFYFLGKRKR